ncbi:MAG: helix-turn-helix domain-containing protein [Promethearchaeota archaeon]
MHVQTALLVTYISGIHKGKRIDISGFFRELWKRALVHLPNDDHHSDVAKLPLIRVFTALINAYDDVIDFDATNERHEVKKSRIVQEPRTKRGSNPVTRELTEKELDVAESRYRVIKPYLNATNKSAEQARMRASEAGVGMSTFYTWIRNFKHDGLQGLKPRNRESGRPRGFSPEVESLMEECIKENATSSHPVPVSRCWKLFSENFSNEGLDLGKMPSRSTFRKRYEEFMNKHETKKE